MPVSRLGTLLLGGSVLLLAPASHGQDLVGCSLVDGQLSCVPGVSADPQAQIRALRNQISNTLSEESAVQQQINGLESLVLRGEAMEGSLLRAALVVGQLGELPASAFHWYRRNPGGSHWIWIETAQGPSYRLTAADVGGQVMVVIVQSDGSGPSRQASQPIGPIGQRAD